MSAFARLKQMIRTRPGQMTVWSESEVTAAVDAFRAEVLAERDTQFVAWLLKKARECPTASARQERAADAIARLASKVARGAVRPDNLRSNFFQPGHTYSDSKAGAGTDWQFRCDSVTAHPENGERAAIGWRHFRGEWEPYAYYEDDYEVHQAVGITDITEEVAA
ncbi:hypothetical protein OIE75_29295 [Streptomyces sp. NBC_01723]|uniref:hypothetical protein n=1 Tax=Streptomyces sp. NBC_01723 TaxID=2975921 RepID=UPI002E36D122|nr:hypothetical protein [Streptomyces sp. NBC_01723]